MSSDEKKSSELPSLRREKTDKDADSFGDEKNGYGDEKIPSVEVVSDIFMALLLDNQVTLRLRKLSARKFRRSGLISKMR